MFSTEGLHWAAEGAGELPKEPADGKRLCKRNGTLPAFSSNLSAIRMSFLIQPPFTWSKPPDVIVSRSQQGRKKPFAGNVGLIMFTPVDFVCGLSTANASKPV